MTGLFHDGLNYDGLARDRQIKSVIKLGAKVDPIQINAQISEDKEDKGRFFYKRFISF